MRRSQAEITIVKERRIYSVLGGLKKKIWYIKQKIKTGHEEILVPSMKFI